MDGDGDADEFFDPAVVVTVVGKVAGGGTNANEDNGLTKLNESLISALVLLSGFTKMR